MKVKGEKSLRLTERDSNLELLRIVAMFCIILYHLIAYFVAWRQPYVVFWKAVQYPLHMGVLLFVLISGYYGIHAKSKGLVHLLFLTFLYYTPLTLADSFLNMNYVGIDGSAPVHGWHGVIQSFLPLSRGPYWFISTYIWLYLFSPIINAFLAGSKKNLYYIVGICGLMSLYMSLVKGDPSLHDGKNLTNFIFLYALGRCIKTNEASLSTIKMKSIILVFAIYNVVLMTVLSFGNIAYKHIIERLFFSYSSIGLLCNALMLFLVFSRLKLRSRVVNDIAASTFPMYLLHHQHLVFFCVIQPVVCEVLGLQYGTAVTLACLSVFTICIMTVSYFADKVLRPVVRVCEAKIKIPFLDTILNHNKPQ